MLKHKKKRKKQNKRLSLCHYKCSITTVWLGSGWQNMWHFLREKWCTNHFSDMTMTQSEKRTSIMKDIVDLNQSPFVWHLSECYSLWSSHAISPDRHRGVSIRASASASSSSALAPATLSVHRFKFQQIMKMNILNVTGTLFLALFLSIHKFILSFHVNIISFVCLCL